MIIILLKQLLLRSVCILRYPIIFWAVGRLTTQISHLFEGLLLALAELLIFKFPLTQFSLQPLDALTQSEFVSGENTTHISIF